MMTIAGGDRTQLVAPACAPLHEAPSTGKLVASVVVSELATAKARHRSAGAGSTGTCSGADDLQKLSRRSSPLGKEDCRKFQRRTPFRVAIGEKRP